MWELLANAATIVATLVAVFTLAYQIRENAIAKKDEALSTKKAAKLKVVSDLIANRFILTGNDEGHPGSAEATRDFNVSLSRIPIDFIENSEVLRLYRGIGYDFTAQKFFLLVKAMLQDAVGAVPAEFDVGLLDNVPTRKLVSRA